MKSASREEQLTLLEMLSTHAIRILSHDAGASRRKNSSKPSSLRAAAMASRMAQNVDSDSSSGGSPIALDEYTARGARFLWPCRMCTVKTPGQFPKAGILYAPGPRVKRKPEGEVRVSSMVYMP